MIKKKLGKIKKVNLGFGGYQEAQFGLSIILGNKDWGTSDFWGFWAERQDSCEWKEADQIKCFGELSLRIRDLLKAAKADDIEKLIDKPIEAEFEGNMLKGWRILTEVI